MDYDAAAHWRAIYGKQSPTGVSWFEAEPTVSLAMIADAQAPPEAPIIDAGGGASQLVDCLIDRGHTDVTVLDLAGAALDAARSRLGARANGVHWIEGSVLDFDARRAFGLWHDRACLHFMTAAADQRRYREQLLRHLAPGGTAIIATFALDGPARCSGRDVRRYDRTRIDALFGDALTLADERHVTHVTPWDSRQAFSYFRLRRSG